uniref:Uncharacterized protein n=1 Tax=Phaeomonas parva TaxID=124430 RepID=A0A6U4LQX9_9STRA|mmetsp:Transcript_9823/g.28857  ORF Transcript_9823/g.28857 Transcript_9823/m.28857 type:complete len:1256 (+) Transcript_9823:149-3916(+)
MSEEQRGGDAPPGEVGEAILGGVALPDEEDAQVAGAPMQEAAEPRRRKKKKKEVGTVDALKAMQDRMKAERAARETEDAEKKRKAMEAAFAPVQLQLQETLEKSRLLRPMRVRLKNESYWYRQRADLGGARHMFRGVTLNEQSNRWEGRLFRTGISEEDGGKEPQLRFLENTYLNELKALKEVEKAARTRDANPSEQSIDGLPTMKDASRILATHFRVLLVSPVFEEMTHTERLELVYEALLEAYWPGPGSFGKPWPAPFRKQDKPRAARSPRRRRGLHKQGTTSRRGPGKRSPLKRGASSRRELSRSPSSKRAASHSPGSSRSRSGSGSPAPSPAKPKEARDPSADEAPTRDIATPRGGSGTDTGSEVESPKSRSRLRSPSPKNTPRRGRAGRRSSRASTKFRKAALELTAIGKLKPKPSTRMRGMSYVGRNVLSLPHLRHLGPFTPTLILDLRSPSEWRPDRFKPPPGKLYGAEHVRTKTLAVALNKGIQEASSRETLLRILRAGEEGASRDGVYAHFFHGLSDAMKQLIVREYRRSNQLLKGQVTFNGEPGRPNSPERKKRTHAEKAAAIFSHSLTDTSAKKQADLEKQVLDKFAVYTRRWTLVAQRLQRIYRFHKFTKVIRRYNRKHRAAMDIQRVLRGHFSRNYASIYVTVAEVAAIRIESRWRGFVSRRATAELRRRKTGACVGMQRRFRGHYTRRYLKYIKLNFSCARDVQAVVRGFLARQRRRAMVRARGRAALAAKMVVRLQCFARTILASQVYESKLRKAVFKRIVVPAAILCQRVYRGVRGWRIGQRKRLERDGAILIQTMGRGYIARQWRKRYDFAQLQWRCAIRIQAAARGYICRELVEKLRERKYHNEVRIPSAIKIQTQFRRHAQQSRWEQRKREWASALRIQELYKAMLARREARLLWEKMKRRHQEAAALVLQCVVRCMFAKRILRKLWSDAVGRRHYAASVIMRAWLQCKHQKAYKRLKRAWEVEKSAEILADLEEEIEDIARDVSDTRQDIADAERRIKLHKRRIKAVKNFQSEALLRIPELEDKFDELGGEEIGQGWAESWANEWSYLGAQLNLSTEELRLHKVQIRKENDAIFNFKLEIEDLEQDMNDAVKRRDAEQELLCRMELTRCGQRAKEDKQRRVREERMKWKVQDVRRTVIRRKRKDLDTYIKEAQDMRTLEEYTTISTWKKMDRRKDEQAYARFRERQDQERKAKERNVKGYGTKHLRETYDAALSATMEILKTGTFEHRNPPPKKR